MRRFHPMSSNKYQKPYDYVSRSSTTGLSSLHISASREKLIKLVAITVALLIGVSALHALLSPKDLTYGLMIDAGSTGSRIHTYTFRKGPLPGSMQNGKLELLYEDFYALKPGLSSFKDEPEKAANSLEPLLERAKSKVPQNLWIHTPVVLRATAGLRMVGEEKAQAILKEVRVLLEASGFLFQGDDWARILGGNEEAVYSWMTVNYLLERNVGDTVGTLEMGGGSSQIAFVAKEKDTANCTLGGEKVEYGGKELELYTTSHLDFGLQKARAVALGKWEEEEKLKGNPCMNKGTDVQVAMPFDEAGKTVTMSGLGNFAQCRKSVEDAVIKPAMASAGCGCNLCTYRGAGQPKAIGEYVAIAFYLERTVALGMRSPMTVTEIRQQAEKVCAMSVGDVSGRYASVPNGVGTDLCLDLTFMLLHLEWGHGITEDSGVKLMVLDKIKDFELGWCLGAMQNTMSKLDLARR